MVCYLIDDDQDDRDFFAMALSEIDPDIKLETADNAAEAIKKLGTGNFHPDVIFLDINMPRIDGWQCLKQVRMIDHARNIPVVIYSTSENGTRLPQHEGYTAFLTKQPKIADLRNKLKGVLSKITG